MSNENFSRNLNNIELNISFSTEKYWDQFYKENSISNFDWYFDTNLIKSNFYDMKNMKLDSEILLLGVGTSNIIDTFIKNKFKYITSVDFSSYLIKQLKEKYEGNNESEEYDCN